MIRQAKILEIPDILALTKACTEEMIRNGIYQWNKEYPSKKQFEKDIDRKELYVLEECDGIIGVIVLTPIMDKEYATVSWLTPDHKNLYIHRLAVLPSYQGKGNAQKLMDFAEEFARANEFLSIRLDTFSKNKRNQDFYLQRGYRQLDSIYIPNQSADPFYSYELIL